MPKRTRRPAPAAADPRAPARPAAAAEADTTPPLRDEPVELLWPAAAALLVALLYLRTLAYRLAWDDVPLIVHNPAMARADGWLQSLTGSFWGAYGRERAAADFYRPLASLSWWLDWHFWDRRAVGFHLSSVLLACACA